MSQFDVHRNIGLHRVEIPFVVVVQSSRFASFGRRVVVPLVAASQVTVTEPNLNPSFHIAGVEVVLHPLELQSVAIARLGPVVGSLHAESDRIIGAIDLVIYRAFR